MTQNKQINCIFPEVFGWDNITVIYDGILSSSSGFTLVNSFADIHIPGGVFLV